MTKNKQTKDYVKEYYEKHPWINGRLWDDDCICESDTVILDNCPNKRCREMADIESGDSKKQGGSIPSNSRLKEKK